MLRMIAPASGSSMKQTKLLDDHVFRLDVGGEARGELALVGVLEEAVGGQGLDLLVGPFEQALVALLHGRGDGGLVTDGLDTHGVARVVLGPRVQVGVVVGEGGHTAILEGLERWVLESNFCS